MKKEKEKRKREEGEEKEVGNITTTGNMNEWMNDDLIVNKNEGTKEYSEGQKYLPMFLHVHFWIIF